MAVRFFISQDVLDGLVAEEQATIDGEQLVVSSRNLQARVEPAVYFLREVEGKPDPNELVGKVKTEEALALRGADHFRKSVILGDSAYDVVEGYLGTAVEGWAWPAGAAEPPPVAVPEAVAPAPAPVAAAHAALPPTWAPPPLEEDIPVDLEVDVVAREPTAEEVRAAVFDDGALAKRPSLQPDVLRRIEASPGFRAPSAPPPESAEDAPARRPPTRSAGGRSKLPTPAPVGARGSRPPPPPGARASRPPRSPSVKPGGEGLESPSRTADELERLLLETIRPTRGKKR
ncbi:MAG: hypothetical protein JXB32_00010 [Deltaproteobacteria bacterium]|nr:hypothetical protein [Deltaproteobacteria bacterium]